MVSLGFLLFEGLAKRRLHTFRNDHVHLTEAGSEALAEAVLEPLARVLTASVAAR